MAHLGQRAGYASSWVDDGRTGLVLEMRRSFRFVRASYADMSDISDAGFEALKIRIDGDHWLLKTTDNWVSFNSVKALDSPKCEMSGSRPIPSSFAELCTKLRPCPLKLHHKLRGEGTLC
jgi:hypothetical protein